MGDEEQNYYRMLPILVEPLIKGTLKKGHLCILKGHVLMLCTDVMY